MYFGLEHVFLLFSAVMYHPENSKYPDVVALTYDEVHKRVTCVYNDHSFYVWSVVEPKRVGKCFSFLFHSACIWGIETFPMGLNVSEINRSKSVASPAPRSASPADALLSFVHGSQELLDAIPCITSVITSQGLPRGTFLTCSSDDTIRAWNLNDGNVKRNIFCPELLKIIYMDQKLNFICDIDLTNTNNSNEKVDANYDGKNGVRCMKISHDGTHLACGDRSGNIT